MGEEFNYICPVSEEERYINLWSQGISDDIDIDNVSPT